MEWCSGVRVPLRHLSRSGAVLAAVCAMALAGCTIEGQPDVTAAQPRGATVSFESIDGLPPGQFQKLVQNLNSEAQSRRLAVLSRESPSAYHVRGYLAATVVKGRTTISWVWDVFDRDDRRALRIEGEEKAKGRHRDAWAAAADAMLNRIAYSSMERLAVFLTSPEAAPNAPVAAVSGGTQMALAGTQDSSPEAAGIFRIFRAHADPVPETAEAPATAEPVAGPVPLPRSRPPIGPAMTVRETLTVAAASR